MKLTLLFILILAVLTVKSARNASVSKIITKVFFFFNFILNKTGIKKDQLIAANKFLNSFSFLKECVEEAQECRRNGATTEECDAGMQICLSGSEMEFLGMNEIANN